MTGQATLPPRAQAVVDAFVARYGAPPEYLVRAPGRVNLIGEHTDYNGGFVFPAAIDREMIIAATPKADRLDREVRVWSLEYEAEDRFSLDQLVRSEEHPWVDYMRGMLSIWQACAFKVRAFDAVIAGNVPQGAGLSSSAAYEVAVGTLVNEMMATGVAPKQLALLAQKAENRFIGVQCGIMDQFISALGRADAALLIDCRSLAARPVPLRLAERGVALVITHSGVRRGLVDSAYNERRAQCEEAVRLLAARLKRDDVKALRDVSLDDFLAHERHLPPLVARRARHVISENERVLEGVECLGRGDLAGFGRLMIASHASLRDDFEVSCEGLDVLVELTQAFAGTIGARMTGAGFGGCTVALLPADRVDAYQAEVLSAYHARTGLTATAWVCQATAGASVLDSPMKRAGLG
ncbi:MAG: galactokinase [Candidatus Sericytochromatia bacterium]|nr:galactokinase [Candidatus Sericytochromatia bacterium]